MKEILITGGAGFVGSHLAHKLVELGYYVKIFDNLYRGKYAYIKDLVETGKATFIEGDIKNYPVIASAIKGSDYVFHEAAVCINYSLAYPEDSILTNVNGSYNVFKASKEANIKRLIFASSASVYGEPDKLPMSETTLLKPISPYCVSKIAGEYYLKIFEKYFDYNILRYFNIYGLKQSVDAYYTSVLMNWIRNINNRDPPIIHGSGLQSMDFVNVHDVTQANILAMHSTIHNEIFNVGSGLETNLNQLAEIILGLYNTDLKPIHQEKIESMVSKRRADITKISKLLGFKPKISLEDGIKEIVYNTLPNTTEGEV